MPPKKVCPTSVAELPEAARQAGSFNELRSAMVGLGCSATQVSAFWKQLGGAATPAKKRKADEAELEAPSAKKAATVAPKTVTKKATPTRAAAKTPRSAPRKSIAKTSTPKRATPKKPSPKAPTPKKPSPKAPTPKKPSPKAPTPKKPSPKAPTPKKPSPKAPTPKKAPSPKGPSVQTAAFALACHADGVDWSKCLDDETHGEKCAKSLRKKFPDLFDCPTCAKKNSSAEAAKGTTGAPPPPPPPPPPMPKTTLTAIKQVTKDFTGASSLVSDKKGIVGMMSGVTLKKVDPAAPRPAFQPIPIVAADGSIKAALANAPNASAAERAKLGQVAEATDFISQIMSKQGKLKKTEKVEKPAPVDDGPRASMFKEMASKKLNKTAGPAKSAYKQDQFAGNEMMATLSKRLGNMRTAFEDQTDESW